MKCILLKMSILRYLLCQPVGRESLPLHWHECHEWGEQTQWGRLSFQHHVTETDEFLPCIWVDLKNP